MTAAERTAAEQRLARYRLRLAWLHATRPRNYRTEARRLAEGIVALEAQLAEGLR